METDSLENIDFEEALDELQTHKNFKTDIKLDTPDFVNPWNINQIVNDTIEDTDKNVDPNFKVSRSKTVFTYLNQTVCPQGGTITIDDDESDIEDNNIHKEFGKNFQLSEELTEDFKKVNLIRLAKGCPDDSKGILKQNQTDTDTVIEFYDSFGHERLQYKNYTYLLINKRRPNKRTNNVRLYSCVSIECNALLKVKGTKKTGYEALPVRTHTCEQHHELREDSPIWIEWKNTSIGVKALIFRGNLEALSCFPEMHSDDASTLVIIYENGTRSIYFRGFKYKWCWTSTYYAQWNCSAARKAGCNAELKINNDKATRVILSGRHNCGEKVDLVQLKLMKKFKDSEVNKTNEGSGHYDHVNIVTFTNADYFDNPQKYVKLDVNDTSTALTFYDTGGHLKLYFRGCLYKLYNSLNTTSNWICCYVACYATAVIECNKEKNSIAEIRKHNCNKNSKSTQLEKSTADSSSSESVKIINFLSRGPINHLKRIKEIASAEPNLVVIFYDANKCKKAFYKNYVYQSLIKSKFDNFFCYKWKCCSSNDVICPAILKLSKGENSVAILMFSHTCDDVITISDKQAKTTKKEKKTSKKIPKTTLGKQSDNSQCDDNNVLPSTVSPQQKQSSISLNDLQGQTRFVDHKELIGYVGLNDIFTVVTFFNERRKKVYYRGYTYLIGWSTPSYMHWMCSKNSANNRCPAALRLSKDLTAVNVEVIESGEHICGPRQDLNNELLSNDAYNQQSNDDDKVKRENVEINAFKSEEATSAEVLSSNLNTLIKAEIEESDMNIIGRKAENPKQILQFKGFTYEKTYSTNYYDQWICCTQESCKKDKCAAVLHVSYQVGVEPREIGVHTCKMQTMVQLEKQTSKEDTLESVMTNSEQKTNLSIASSSYMGSSTNTKEKKSAAKKIETISKEIEKPIKLLSYLNCSPMSVKLIPDIIKGDDPEVLVAFYDADDSKLNKKIYHMGYTYKKMSTDEQYYKWICSKQRCSCLLKISKCGTKAIYKLSDHTCKGTKRKIINTETETETVHKAKTWIAPENVENIKDEKDLQGSSVLSDCNHRVIDSLDTFKGEEIPVKIIKYNNSSHLDPNDRHTIVKLYSDVSESEKQLYYRGFTYQFKKMHKEFSMWTCITKEFTMCKALLRITTFLRKTAREIAQHTCHLNSPNNFLDENKILDNSSQESILNRFLNLQSGDDHDVSVKSDCSNENDNIDFENSIEAYSIQSLPKENAVLEPQKKIVHSALDKTRDKMMVKVMNFLNSNSETIELQEKTEFTMIQTFYGEQKILFNNCLYLGQELGAGKVGIWYCVNYELCSGTLTIKDNEVLEFLLHECNKEDKFISQPNPYDYVTVWIYNAIDSAPELYYRGYTYRKVAAQSNKWFCTNQRCCSVATLVYNLLEIEEHSCRKDLNTKSLKSNILDLSEPDKLPDENSELPILVRDRYYEPFLIYKGFLHYKAEERGQYQYWWCTSKKSDNCSGCISIKDNCIISIVSKHTCFLKFPVTEDSNFEENPTNTSELNNKYQTYQDFMKHISGMTQQNEITTNLADCIYLEDLYKKQFIFYKTFIYKKCRSQRKRTFERWDCINNNRIMNCRSVLSILECEIISISKHCCRNVLNDLEGNAKIPHEVTVKQIKPEPMDSDRFEEDFDRESLLMNANKNMGENSSDNDKTLSISSFGKSIANISKAETGVANEMVFLANEFVNTQDSEKVHNSCSDIKEEPLDMLEESEN